MKSMGATGSATMPSTGGKTEMPNLPTGATGVAPPAKYAQKGNGLSVEVTGGDQKHDIKLTP